VRALNRRNGAAIHITNGAFLLADIAWTLTLHMAALLTFATLWRLAGNQIAGGALCTAVGASAVYWAAEVFGQLAQGHIAGLSQLNWNWLGKAFAIVFSLALIAMLRMPRAEVGLTWRQKAGWIVPVLVVMTVTCVFSWITQFMSHEGPHLTQERLMFQASMPGLDEELFWRGVLLALLTRAFGSGCKFWGAAFGPAEIAITVLFAAAHGLRLSHGTIAFNASAFAITGLIGAALMWLRTRTGSLAIPMLTHNLVNFGNSFF